MELLKSFYLNKKLFHSTTTSDGPNLLDLVFRRSSPTRLRTPAFAFRDVQSTLDRQLSRVDANNREPNLVG